MSDKPISAEEKRSAGRLVQPSLVLSTFAVQPHGILIGLLLVDIALAFGVPVGVAGQIRTISYVVSVIIGLLMGVLSIRFRHKSLLVMGLLFLSISALGCALAPSFIAMLMLFSIWGVALAMVSPMGLTLTGEHFPQEKRASVIGWITAGGAISYVVGAPAIGFIAGFGGWRMPFLGFILPVSLLGLLLAIKGVPNSPSIRQSALSMGDYLAGFEGVFSNRSADACLAGSAFSMAAWAAILTYAPSFYRQRFLFSTSVASAFMLVAASCYTLGSVISGRFVRRFGRKPPTVLAALFAGIFTVLYTLLPDVWLSAIASFLACLFGGMRVTASNSLTLEQVPKFRGTMMSISSAATNLGSSLGAGVGGLALLLFGYDGMAISLGSMGVAAAIVFQLLATDPAKADKLLDPRSSLR